MDFSIIVVYEYEAGLYFVFIEWCGDKIKKMFVGKRGNACGFVLDTDTNQLPLIIPPLFPLLHLYLHFSSRVLGILVFHFVASLSFPSCVSFLTVFHMWSCDYRGMTSQIDPT